MLSIIVASDINGGIGYNNKLLFHIKEDMRRFKELTTGHKIIMGRKTFESLPNGALPNRHNIVLTTNSNTIQTFSPTQSLIFKDNLEELIDEYKDSEEEVFVIGGGFIYQQFLPHCKKIYLTVNFKEYEADTHFKFNTDEWDIDYWSQILESDYGKYEFMDLVKK
jgi:dihydrofolate reductase